jgi:hypothetical protein
MPNLSQAKSTETDNPRWFQLWIASGLALAVLLLVTSIHTYVVVSRRLMVDHLRSDLSSQVAMIDQQSRRSAVQNDSELPAILQQAVERSNGRIAWIEVQDGWGNSVAQAGIPTKPVFSDEYIQSHLQNRQPIFDTVRTRAGTLLVEVFPFRLPGATPRRGTVQLAAFLEGGGVALWPLKRSLMINSSAALMLLISLIAIALRLRSYIAGRRLEQEIEIARSVQRDLLPSSKRELEGFEVAADYLPASRVSGDFYDAFRVRTERAAFVLGDVSGKGLPAALLMGVMHGAVRSSSWTESPLQHQQATRQINRLLCERAATERYATMFWSYFDPQSQHLKYINAGHCAPLVLKTSQRNTILRLSLGGPVLGLLADAEYQQGSVRLEPGDVMVLYSDGIIEATNPDEEEFGEDRVLAIMKEHANDTAEAIRNHILLAADAFTGQSVPQDDRTLVVIVYQGVAQRRVTHESQADSKIATVAA